MHPPADATPSASTATRPAFSHVPSIVHLPLAAASAPSEAPLRLRNPGATEPLAASHARTRRSQRKAVASLRASASRVRRSVCEISVRRGELGLAHDDHRLRLPRLAPDPADEVVE